MFLRMRHFSIFPKESKISKQFSTLPFLFLALWLLLVFFGLPILKTNLSQDILSSTSTTPLSCIENVSVYVYDLPEKFNQGLLKDCRHLNMYTNMCPHVANNGLGQPLPELGPTGSTNWFATNQFTSENIFHARIENHPCRTWDPNEATLFYVPFYGGLHASSKFREADHKIRDALAVELSEFVSNQRWWQRKKGKDHFLVLGRTAWDFMRTDGGQDYGANVLLNLPTVKNMSALVIERHPWKGEHQYGIPYPSYFHPFIRDEMLMWQNYIGNVVRPHLFSFIGAQRNGVEKKAVLRNEIIRQCDISSRCNLLNCGHGGSKCHSPSEVLAVMTSSQFCMQAPGDSFTRRSTFDAVLAGCIPVFFSRHTAYSQYAWYFPADPNEYSVYIDKDGNGGMRMIEEELLKIPTEKVERMRKTVIDLIPSVTYMHPNSSSSLGFQDAVDIALSALSKHVESS